MSDPIAARLRLSHTLTVTETGLQFLLDARRRGEACRPVVTECEEKSSVAVASDKRLSGRTKTFTRLCAAIVDRLKPTRARAAQQAAR